jgi:outer membrane protein assembly complex protein YaeT
MMRVRSLLAVALLGGAVFQPVLVGQASPYEGRTIANIQFQPAMQPLDPMELYEILPLKSGQPLRMADIRASIERLFATGRYADIQVGAETYNDAVIIRFITTNSWFIGNVRVSGVPSSPPNRAQLENATDLDLGQPFTPAKLDQAKEGLQRLLENNGLYRTHIQPVFDYDAQYQQIHIRFEIDSGPRARFSAPRLNGDLKMDPEKILSATSWRRWLTNSWKSVTQTRVRQGLEGVRSLYQKKDRLEAKVTLESMEFEPETTSALPTLRIDPGPQIDVQAIGAKVSQKKLRRYVPIFEEHAVDHDLLVEGSRNLRDYLQGQGYFEAQVEFKEQRVVNDHAAIDYLVATGVRHRLTRIVISGNKYFTTANLRERMFLQETSFLQFPHGRYSEALLSRDEEAILNLYQSNGFRDVTVKHRIEDMPHGKMDDLRVFLEITEGPQYRVNSLAVEGIEQLDREAILATLSSSEGQPFSEFNVAVDRDTILARYFQNGFPNATFEWSSKPGAQPTLVDLRFSITEGSRQTVRQVLVSGLTTTRPDLVNRNLKLNPGDPLSPTAITETQRRLYDLGVFEKVDAAIQNPDGDTPSKYVLYELDEAHRYSMAVGVGAELARIGGCQTCFDSPAGQTGFAPRVSFNIARNNMWGLAHTLGLRTRVSTLRQQVLLNYAWPRFQDKDTLALSFTALYDNSRDVRTFSSKRQEASIQLSQRISKATTLFYRYTYRHVSVDESTLKIDPLLIPLIAQPVLLGLVSGSMVQDRRDDPVDSHRGIYNTLDVGLAEHIFGSERNFLRVLARNSTYHAIGKKYVLARTTEFGDIYSFHYGGPSAEAIPLPERFFGGGSASNRGFPDFQAGPRDLSTGFPLGGTALLFNQTELRFPLIGDNIGGVLFHDAGNVYSRLENVSFRVHQRDLTDFDYMVHAAGFGIRYRTPIGPVRLDLAYSINPPRFFGFKGSQEDLINAGVNPCAPPSTKCQEQSVSHFQFFFSIGQTF